MYGWTDCSFSPSVTESPKKSLSFLQSLLNTFRYSFLYKTDSDSKTAAASLWFRATSDGPYFLLKQRKHVCPVRSSSSNVWSGMLWIL
jgi:hypothetical protein